MRTRRAPIWQFLSDVIHGIDAGHAIRHGLPPRPPRVAASSHIDQGPNDQGPNDQGPRSRPPATVGGVAPQLRLAPWTPEVTPSRN